CSRGSDEDALAAEDDYQRQPDGDQAPDQGANRSGTRGQGLCGARQRCSGHESLLPLVTCKVQVSGQASTVTCNMQVTKGTIDAKSQTLQDGNDAALGLSGGRHARRDR